LIKDVIILSPVSKY